MLTVAPPSAVSGHPGGREPAVPKAGTPQPNSFGWTSDLTPKAIELPPIVVHRGHASTELQAQGRLIEVNNQYRFVVIDKGTEDGIRAGATFDVRRGGRRIAEVVAVRVRPQYTACDIILSRSPEAPQIGDVAVLRRP